MTAPQARYRALALVLAVVVPSLLRPAPAIAGAPGLETSLLVGATRVDPDLSRYDWEVSPQMNWGLQALLVAGRLGLGARGWTVETTQSVVVPGILSVDLGVRTLAAEAVARFDVIRVADLALYGQGSYGRMRMSYGPDVLRFVPPGSGAETVVPLDPVDGWIAGAGAGIRLSLPAGPSIGALLDHQTFRLATAHRAGDEIVERQESLGHWTLRAEIGWGF